MSPVTITIDGPAASGKSTAARGVARALGIGHVSTGLLYRAVTWAALEEGWIDAEPGEFGRRVRDVDVSLESVGPGGGDYRVEVNGQQPGADLHDRAVSRRVSEVSARRAVREHVDRVVRREARRRSLVCDGRDMGTEVFPEADLKIFLVASAVERARRRLGDYGEEPTPESIAREAERIRARDEADSTRELSPLRKAEDAVEVDTTELAPEQVVEAILAEARRRAIPRRIEGARSETEDGGAG